MNKSRFSKRTIVIAVPLLFLGQIQFSGCDSKDVEYGRPIQGSDVLTLQELLQNREKLIESDIVVEACIGSVCQTAGCWCFLEEGQDQLYVSMSTFSLPPDVSKRRCRAEGKLVIRNDRLTLLATGITLLKS